MFDNNDVLCPIYERLGKNHKKVRKQRAIVKIFSQPFFGIQNDMLQWAWHEMAKIRDRQAEKLVINKIK